MSKKLSRGTETSNDQTNPLFIYEIHKFMSFVIILQVIKANNDGIFLQMILPGKLKEFCMNLAADLQLSSHKKLE